MERFSCPTLIRYFEGMDESLMRRFSPCINGRDLKVIGLF